MGDEKTIRLHSYFYSGMKYLRGYLVIDKLSSK